jgi:hypothetical protein
VTEEFRLRRSEGAVPARRRQMRTYPQTRQRTINLRFEYQNNGYLVHAWGAAFPEDGAGAYMGRLNLSADVVHAAVANLRDTWQRLLVERKEQTADGVGFPFVDQWDLRGEAAGLLDAVGPKLAQAGWQLFTVLFSRGDEGLSEIGECLEAALASGEQIISIHSGDLFVPWPMLYTPVGGDGTWSMSGFWGYRHLIEHCFPRAAGFDIRIHAAGKRPIVGLNVDPRVDDQFPPTPCVAPIVEFFQSRGDPLVRTTRDEFQAALTHPEFTDQVLYFACHGFVGGPTGGSTVEPWLYLADDEPIRYTDLIAWLPADALPTSPVVFINACQGGQMHSRFYPSFGAAFIAGGANCLVGPQIDLPRAFSREYTRRFFSALLDGARIGDIGRDLAREFADVHHNPLGLIYSIYRGLDTHIFDDGRA